VVAYLLYELLYFSAVDWLREAAAAAGRAFLASNTQPATEVERATDALTSEAQRQIGLQYETADAHDVVPGNGVCETAPGNGVCTLRAALEEANVLPGADTVSVPGGVFLLSLNRLVISSDVSVTGAGIGATVIDANFTDTVLSVLSGTVTLSSATVRNGRGPTAGGILNAGNLTLNSVLVINSDTVANGGGIANTITGGLTLNSSQVANSRATNGGGIFSPPGGSVTVNDSSVTGNQAVQRGGGFATVGPLTLNRTIVRGNTSGSDGGGVVAFSLAITDSEISGNTAGGDGGGVGMTDGTISNSTISGNRATHGGGVVIERGRAAIGNTTIGNSTFAVNTSTSNQGAALFTVAGTLANAVAVAFHHTIFQEAPGNPGNCFNSPPSMLTSTGYNIISDSTCPMGAIGDRPNTPALLGPLQNNGGPTQTHALLPGSPAIDAFACPPPAADQRGVARPQGPACDIGAFELAFVAPTPTPTPSRCWPRPTRPCIA
jgi:hypothetical protein